MRRASTRTPERGAVVTEFAIIASVLLMILFGLVEFGFAWETRLTTQNATRAGARVGSSLGTDRLADYSILKSVEAALGGDASRVDLVVIYKATAQGGGPPDECVGATPASQDDLCNVYTGGQMVSLGPSAFAGSTTCASTAPDQAWCPTERERRQSVGADYVGVHVRLRHQFVLRLFGSELTLTDHTVMRLEPGA